MAVISSPLTTTRQGHRRCQRHKTRHPAAGTATRHKTTRDRPAGRDRPRGRPCCQETQDIALSRITRAGETYSNRLHTLKDSPSDTQNHQLTLQHQALRRVYHPIQRGSTPVGCYLADSALTAFSAPAASIVCGASAAAGALVNVGVALGIAFGASDFVSDDAA